jgi:hypothetical protein
MHYRCQGVETLRLGCRAYRRMFIEVRVEDAEAAAEIDLFQYLT